ncbi:MAG: nucleotide-binding protein [Clostridiales bacterium]|nr:nucleotide-binding protein [Clostridiales bacterium]
MRLARKNQKPITLTKKSGEKYELMANLDSYSNAMLTDRMDIPFEEGDYLSRTQQNGITEVFEITKINYGTGIINMAVRKTTDLSAVSPEREVITVEGKKAKATPQERVAGFLRTGEQIKVKEYHPAQGGFPFSYYGGPMYDEWMAKINIFNERYLKEHPSYDSIHKAYKQKDNNPSSYDDMMAQLKVVASDDEFWENITESISEEQPMEQGNNKVFIVHGHDDGAKQTIARYVEQLDYEAIILHEQPDGGNTIIEKIEQYTDVAFAIVLYTPCDIGYDKDKEADKKYRARQNVVFEHGYLIGKLGRKNVCAVVVGDVETPGDISGVVYKKMDSEGAWRFEIAKEMKNAGLEVDVNKLI